MKKESKYIIVEDNDELICIRDTCEPDRVSVTNDGERVVKELAPLLKGRRLEYFDSDGIRDQVLIVNGKFAGFTLCSN